MKTDQMLANIQQARKLMDEVYYFAEAYNRAHSEAPSVHMVEVEPLMCWADCSAMDAETEIRSFANDTRRV